MNKLKEYKTTIIGLIIGLQQLAQTLGIEIPKEWKDYIMLFAGALLLISGDPKMRDFIGKKGNEMTDNLIKKLDKS